MQRSVLLLIVFSFIAATLSIAQSKSNSTTPPNIIFIFLDDLGYGDLSSTGNTEIATPNIDKIGSEGIVFPQAYSASPYCSPSRTALLTGRYPIRTGVNAVLFPTAKEGLPASEITIAEQLKTKGYATAIIGKWHLGHLPQYLPTTQGFDYYFGIPFSNDMTPHYYIKNTEILPEHVDQRFTTQRYTDEAINFIKANKKGPFFLYLPHSMPHVPLYTTPEFEGKSKYGRYGDVVQEIDFHIGRILQTLKDEGLDENTLVVFSSDNGPWKTQGKLGGSSGIFRGAKGSVFEGGLRIPLYARWPAKIKSGSVYPGIVSNTDWFPTFSKLVGAPLPTDRVIDGEDLSGVLAGAAVRKGDRILYYYPTELRGIRKGDWKLLIPYNDPRIDIENDKPDYPGRQASNAHGLLLFNLKNDPSEKTNLSSIELTKVKELLQELETWKGSLGNLPPTIHIR